MHRALVASLVSLLLLASGAGAITWNFAADGDTQGWLAFDAALAGAVASSTTPLRFEVGAGVWRIQTGPFQEGRFPAVKLVSPPLGYDSALFDRVQVRCRVVHHSPVAGYLGLGWTNEHNSPGAPEQNWIDYGFGLGVDQTYTTQWQELTLAGIADGRVDAGTLPLRWAGQLKGIDLGLVFAKVGPRELTWTGGPGDVPEAVEIDWIRLTGVEELLQGELPPPLITKQTPFGQLFAPAVFYPVCDERLDASDAWGGLGDVDGDGDLDLVAPYATPGGTTSWLVALNQGDGSFGRAVYRHGTTAYKATVVDVDRDGRADVVSTDGNSQNVVYVRSVPEGGWVVQQRFADRYLWGVADADGDGGEDLWLLEYPDQRTLWLLRNEGAAGFGAPRAVGTDLMAEGYSAGGFYPGLGPQGEVGVSWWRKADDVLLLALFSDGDFGARTPLPFRYAGFHAYPVFHGDLDGDGDVDEAYTVAQTLNQGIPVWVGGLRLWFNRGDGTADTLAWPQDVTLPAERLQVVDLNRDGHPDVAFVDSDLRQPAVVVALGVGEGLPVQEGRYPLSGRGGYVQAGDVDGDGDIDLVVYEKAALGQGGVHVLLNRLADGVTAVSEDPRPAVPPGFALAPAYPNPFNPQVTIPFTLGAQVPQARLLVYNLLGQPVRMLVDGPLAAGPHRVVWDGTYEPGQPVPSGVYLIRLVAGRQSVTSRCVKVE